MRKVRINIVISAIIIFGAVVVIELALREFYPVYLAGYIGAYQYDEKLGVRLKDNIHIFKTTDYQQEIYTNRFGTINFQDSFDDYDTKIFAIGDSYTQGTGLPVDASYPFQLSMMLNMKDGEYLTQYAVVNLGLASFGTKQAIMSLPIYKKIYGKPDYILYLGCSNDNVDDILFEKGYRHKHLVEGNPRWGLFLMPVQWFTNGTEIGKRLKLAAGILRQRSYYNKNSYEEKIIEGKVEVAELQADKLEELLAISKEMNAQLIDRWSDLPQFTYRSYGWLKHWAEKNDVAFADWHPKVLSTLNAMPNLPIMNQHSGKHFRTWVNNLIAKSFSEHIP